MLLHQQLPCRPCSFTVLVRQSLSQNHHATVEAPRHTTFLDDSMPFLCCVASFIRLTKNTATKRLILSQYVISAYLFLNLYFRIIGIIVREEVLRPSANETINETINEPTNQRTNEQTTNEPTMNDLEHAASTSTSLRSGRGKHGHAVFKRRRQDTTTSDEEQSAGEEVLPTCKTQ